MSKRSLVLIATAVIGLAATSSTASAQLIGDKDCFGNIWGTNPCPASFPIPGIPSDGRSAGEAVAVNGAQQTDYYSANFSPLAPAFNLLWNLGIPLSAGASIEFRSYGLQANTFGAFQTTFNGTVETGFLNFEDGATTVATHTFFLDAGMISRANTAGQLVITLDRSNSNDAVAYDYFELKNSTETVVPEPSTYAMMGAGLAGLGLAGRRRRKTA